MKNFIRIAFIVFTLCTSVFKADAKIHTPDHYEHAIRQCFREDRWEAGKYMLDEARPYYGGMSPFLELDGWYCYHVKDYNKARRYLHNALEEDSSNTHARELMVKVEEETGNYTSAICYINELLERNAYSQGLWEKKIELYRTIHNDVEADRLLNRLYEIYPNDTTIRNNVTYRYEEKLIKQKSVGDIAGQLESAENLVKLQPDNVDNYLILANLYLQQGRTEDAIRVSGGGAKITNDATLLKKHIGILCGQGRYQAAIVYLNELPKSAVVNSLLSEVQEEQARFANANDPYTAYGRVYERTHNKESFNYLINTSLSRGYYNDALYYVKDYIKRNEEDEDILYKEYSIYKALGNEIQATYALQKLYEKNPNDQDICYELCSIYYKQGVEYISIGEYANAIKPLEFVVEFCEDRDICDAAANHLNACFIELKKYNEALDVLNPDDTLYIPKKAELFAKIGDYPSALDILKPYGDSLAYGDIAIPYIKSLIDNRRYREAIAVVDTSLNYANNKEIYMYGISAASILKKDKTKYIEDGFKLYSSDDYFINQFAGLSKDRAMKYRKDKDYGMAMSVIDSALVYKPNDNDLLYTKGLIFENMHQYDSAYVYQKYYKPSPVETFEYKKKMEGFVTKSLKNTLAIDYQRARLGTLDIVTANAGITYTRQINDKNSFDISFNYAGRDDGATADELLTQQAPGGVGIQIGAGYSHTFDKDWAVAVNAAWANKYFPQINAKLSVSKELPNDWLVEGHIQYRKLDSYSKVGKKVIDVDGSIGYAFDHWEHTQPNMISFGGYANKTIADNLDLNFNVDGMFIKNNLYFNANTKIQYSPIDGNKSRVYATGGFGTAPEITLIDNSMPNSFEKLNTFVGGGGVYTLTPNLDIGLEGTWHTMYKQNQILTNIITETTSYINLFYMHAQVIIHF